MDVASKNEEDSLLRAQNTEDATAHQRGGHPWEEKRAIIVSYPADIVLGTVTIFVHCWESLGSRLS